MQPTSWTTQKIKQCEKLTKQAMLSDEHTLVLFSEDFGRIHHSKPQGVFIPPDYSSLQAILRYANEHALPLTIRGKGLSQGGQSLAITDGLIIDMSAFDKIKSVEKDSVWVQANASFAELLAVSLDTGQRPFVVPYNCHLPIAGVISAGGVGASSFKWGPIVSQVVALDVITAEGEKQRLTSTSPLFHAFLGGQGQFGIITDVCLKLKPCKKNVRSFFLIYLEKESWLQDLAVAKQKADFMEVFCSPAIQGAKLSKEGRFPFAQWFYSLHVSVEFDEQAPMIDEIIPKKGAWKLIHTQDEPMSSYLRRHDGRFEAMKRLGQWDLPHPWYECFVFKKDIMTDLESILTSLPLHYATILQLVPVAKKKSSGFFMLPEGDKDDIFAVMILNAGLPEVLIPSCISTIKQLDKRFLEKGGKRYLSGFLGEEISVHYWKNHFGERYTEWYNLKNQYDPHHIFCSLLHQR